MRRMIAAAVVALLVGGVGGYVLHGQGKLQILGSGSFSCGRWLEDRRGTFSDWGFAAEWTNGYLTGLQDGSAGIFALTSNQTGDLAGNSAWIDQYCQSHPIDNLKAASFELFKALRVK